MTIRDGQVLSAQCALVMLALSHVGCSDADTDGTDRNTLPSSHGATIHADAGLFTIFALNTPYVTVTLCDASSRCADIPYVLLDTGSTGLRVFSSGLELYGADLELPTVASGDGVLGSCELFTGNYLWGAVRYATVRIAELSTKFPIPIQVANDSAVPLDGGQSNCAPLGGDSKSDFVGALPALGILGVGPQVDDVVGYYFECTGASCKAATPAETTDEGTGGRLLNPLAHMPDGYNNGFHVAMPTVGPSGAKSAIGKLTLGIETTDENGLIEGAQVYAVDESRLIDVTVNGVAAKSLLDTGANAYYLSLPDVPLCKNKIYYCPESVTAVDVEFSSGNVRSGPMTISIANAEALLVPPYKNVVFENVGGWASPGNWNFFGMPFFYGRDIAFGFGGTSLNGQPYPNGFVAF